MTGMLLMNQELSFICRVMLRKQIDMVKSAVIPLWSHPKTVCHEWCDLLKLYLATIPGTYTVQLLQIRMRLGGHVNPIVICVGIIHRHGVVTMHGVSWERRTRECELCLLLPVNAEARVAVAIGTHWLFNNLDEALAPVLALIQWEPLSDCGPKGLWPSPIRKAWQGQLRRELMQIHSSNEQTEATATVTINELPIQSIDSRYRDMFIHWFS